MTAFASDTTRPGERDHRLAWLLCPALGALACIMWSALSPHTPDISAPDELRAGQLRDHDVPPDGYMMVVAYGDNGEVGRWDGAVDARVMKPTRFIATRATGNNKWTWKPALPEPPRINTPGRSAIGSGSRNDGSQTVEAWARRLSARRVVVLVVPHPGEPDDDASRTGMGTQGMGSGRDNTSTSRPERDTVTTTVTTSGPVDPRREVGAEVGSGSESEPSGAGDDDGPGTTDTSGQAPDASGTGTSADGNTRGSPLGGESPSWVHNPRAEIAIRGARVPADGGRRGGSANGTQDGEGNIDGAGWLNVLDVPEVVAPAVAVAMIAAEANVTGFGHKLANRTVRRLARKDITDQVEREVAAQAKAEARRLTHNAEARMKAAKPAAPPAEHIDEIIDYMPEELEVAFYRDLGALAHNRVGIYRAMIAGGKGATDKVSKHVVKLARENRAAWRHIEAACDARTRSVRGASTSASTPGHMVARPKKKGGLGPVMAGLRGEARVRAVHNIGSRKLIRINGRARIPDGVTETVLTEVKNVKKLSFTRQLKDYLAIAQERGLRFDLFVRRDTRMSKQLKAAFKKKQIHLRYIP